MNVTLVFAVIVGEKARRHYVCEALKIEPGKQADALREVAARGRNTAHAIYGTTRADKQFWKWTPDGAVVQVPLENVPARALGLMDDKISQLEERGEA